MLVFALIILVPKAYLKASSFPLRHVFSYLHLYINSGIPSLAMP